MTPPLTLRTLPLLDLSQLDGDARGSGRDSLMSCVRQRVTQVFSICVDTA